METVYTTFSSYLMTVGQAQIYHPKTHKKQNNYSHSSYSQSIATTTIDAKVLISCKSGCLMLLVLCVVVGSRWTPEHNHLII